MNNDQEGSVSSAVYKYDTSTNAAFFKKNLPDSIAKYINFGKFIIKKVFLLKILTYKSHQESFYRLQLKQNRLDDFFWRTIC